MKFSPICLCSLLFFSPLHGEASSERPNIICILSDDQGSGDTGFNGNREVLTPNMDRLAASGIRFDNGYVTAPQCIPSRAGLLLGRYQQRFGMECQPDSDKLGLYHLPEGVTTVADELSRAGYRTGIIGKWHMGESESTQPYKKGFEWCAYLRGGMGYHFADTDQEKGQFRNAKNEVLSVDGDGFLPRIMTDKALEFVNNRDARPFFLYLAYHPPHWPLEAPKESLAEQARMDDPNRRLCCAMISEMDKGIGRLLKLLKDSGLDRNTLVVFLSDNGAPMYTSKGMSPVKMGENASTNGVLSGYKGDLLEGGIHVPFVMSWPGRLPADTVVRWPVSSLDLAATFLAAAAAPPMPDADGVNLLPYLVPEISANGPERALFWRFHTQWCTEDAVRRGPWKWVRTKTKEIGVLKRGEVGLFNLDQDPSEQHNLISEHPEITASMENEFSEWNKTLSDPKWTTVQRIP